MKPSDYQTSGKGAGLGKLFVAAGAAPKTIAEKAWSDSAEAWRDYFDISPLRFLKKFLARMKFEEIFYASLRAQGF